MMNQEQSNPEATTKNKSGSFTEPANERPCPGCGSGWNQHPWYFKIATYRGFYLCQNKECGGLIEKGLVYNTHDLTHEAWLEHIEIEEKDDYDRAQGLMNHSPSLWIDDDGEP